MAMAILNVFQEGFAQTARALCCDQRQQEPGITSMAGRSRVGGISSEDHRVYLYKEYLRVIAKHSPSVFVMENVKGILSSSFFEQIISDLKSVKYKGLNYNIYSLVDKKDDFLSFIFDIEINNLKDFTNLISELKVRSLNFKIIRNRKTNQLYVN